MHVVTALILLIAAGSPADDQLPDRRVDTWRVQALVQQLGSESFAQRQSALRELWLLGPAVEPALRPFANHPDREISMRVRRLLEHMEMGLSPEMPREMARAIFDFRTGDYGQRAFTLQTLRDEKRFGLMLDLLQSLDDSAQRTALVQETIGDAARICRALGVGEPSSQPEFDLLDQLMAHPVMWESYATACAMYAYLRGNAPWQLSQLAVGPEAVADAVLLRMVSLQRMQGHYDQALQTAERLDSWRIQLVTGLLSEQGKWPELSDWAWSQQQETDMPPWELISRATLAHHFADQGSRRKHTLDTILNKAGDQYDPIQVTHLLLSCGEVQAAIHTLAPHDSPQTFRTLCFFQRYPQAFELIGMQSTPEGREEWIRRHTRKIRSLVSRYERLQIVSDYQQAHELFELGLGVGLYLATLGLEDEAAIHLQRLADSIRRDDDFFDEWNQSVLRLLVHLEMSEQVWEFCTRHLPHNDEQLARRHHNLFPDAVELARFWEAVLGPVQPDHVARTQTIAALLHSPLAPAEPAIDVDSLLERASLYVQRLPDSVKANSLVLLAKTCSAFSRDQQARDDLLQAAYLQHSPAMLRLGDLSRSLGDWHGAEKWYRAAWEADANNTLAGYLLAECLVQLGQSALGRDQKTALLVGLLDPYRVDQLADQLGQRGLTDDALQCRLAIAMAKLPGDSEFDYFHQGLAALVGETQPELAVRQLQLAAINGTVYRDSYSMQFANYPIETRIRRAHQAMQQSQFEVVREELAKVLLLQPANPQVAEEFVLPLQAAGRQADADQLFQQVASSHLRLLEQHPDSPMHLNNYAWVCATCQRGVAAALPYAERAVARKPNNTNYLDTLAEIQFRLGAPQQALALAERCVRLDPEKQHYRQQLQRFRAANPDEQTPGR